MKYFQPKSVTWLAGLGLIITGVSKCLAEGGISVEGIALIGEGLGLIGIRGALKEKAIKKE